MKLTDTTVRNAKWNHSKICRLSDGDCLYLEITPTGKKGWRFRYRFANREKCISFGSYPEVSLKLARRRKEEARELIAEGIDPSEQRKVDKFKGDGSEKNTFKALANAWFNTRKIEWSNGYQRKVLRILEKNLYPWIGPKPINQVTAPVLLEALRKTQAQKKFSTTADARQIAGQVFRFAVLEGQAERDITPDLREALTTPKVKHRAALTDTKDVGRLMLAIDAYEGSPQVCCALRLIPLVFVRPGELRKAEWDEIDWEKKQWCVDADKTKTGMALIVPLSRQSLKILHDIHPFTRDSRYVFPNPRSSDRPMSENAMLVALRTMGYTKEQVVPHGFRATARTLLDEELEYRIDWIEQQLGHVVRDTNGVAYNRTKHLKRRREMMQAWADYLDGLKAKAGSTRSRRSR